MKQTAEEMLRESDLELRELGQFEGVIELMEQYASQTEKEEVESGWVIVDPDYKELWETFRHLELDPRDWFGDVKWDSLTRQGYKCVRAERVTRLTDTTKTKEK